MSDAPTPQEIPGNGLLQPPRLVQLFPQPWSFDVSPQETPADRNSAMVYTAGSTPVCETRGEHAEALAKLIVESVNAASLDEAFQKARTDGKVLAESETVEYIIKDYPKDY